MAKGPSKTRRTEWVAHGERTLYSSDWLSLNLVDVTAPDGRRFEHHVVRMNQVAVVAVLDEPGKHLLMLTRHRFIDDSWGWEVPMGIVERDEAAAAAAAREVEEETGWRPQQLQPVLSFQPAIGISDSPHHLFTARGAERVGAPSDVTEADVVGWVPISRLMAMVTTGEIRDGATLVAVLHVLAEVN